MKMIGRLRRKNGFTLVELVVVVAIIGVLAGLLIPTMYNVVINSQIASANHLAKTIRDRTAEFLTKLDTQMDTHVGGAETVVIKVDNGVWTLTGGSSEDWIDKVNHWNTLPQVTTPDADSKRDTELLSYLAVVTQGMGTAYIELHVEYSHVIGVVLIQGASQPAYVMPSLQDMRDGVFDFDGSDKAGRLGDGTVLGTSPILSFP